MKKRGEIKITDDKILFFYEYNENFIKDMKKNKCLWNGFSKCWYKKIDYEIINFNTEILQKYYDNEEIEKVKKVIEKIENEKQEKIEMSKKANSNFEVPAPQGLEYYPFQKAGIEWLVSKNGTGLIADEMGLGKTIQVIGYMNIVNEYPVLIVCPATLKYNWEKELKKWLIHNKKIQIIEGKDDIIEDADIYIINYDIIQHYVDKLNEKNLHLLVIDECHYIKNYKAQRTKAVQKIKAQKVIALSGTPLLNRPIELWPTLELLGFPMKFWDFAKRYCNAHQTRFGWDLSGQSNLEELSEKLRLNVMLRREKKDVLTELPDKIRTVISLRNVLSEDIKMKENEIKEILKKVEKMNEEIQRLRDIIKNTDKEDEKEKAEKELDSIIVKKKDTINVAFTKIEKYRQEVARQKLPFVIEFIRDIVEQNNGNKVIVFCYHKEIFDTLLNEFKDIAVGISGDTNSQDRIEAVDKFQNDKNIKVFVGNIRACSEGITLTASSKIVFAEYDWTPARMTQAEDRAHRIGQKDIVNSYWFAMEGTIDEMFINKIVEKMKIIKEVLQSNNDLENLYELI